MDRKLKTNSLTFPSVTLQTAVSSCRTYGCPLARCLPPIFHSDNLTVHQPLQPQSPCLSYSIQGKNRVPLAPAGPRRLCTARWGNVPHRLISAALQSSSETNACCQIQLHNRMLHCGGNGSIRPLALHSLKSSRQLRLDFNLAHMSCLTCLNCVCAQRQALVFVVCLSECLHVMEIVEVTAVLDFPGPRHNPPTTPTNTACPPREAPVFMGKSRLYFRQHSLCLAERGRVSNAENSNTRVTWGTPGPNTAGAVTSLAWRNAVLLSPNVRNSLRFMTQLPTLEKWPRLADSGNY